MSFLNPLLLLGALGLGVPIYLHLRSRTGTVHAFAAVRFLEERKRPRRKGLLLRDPWLFLARALALLGIVMAFAWPYLRRGGAEIVESRVHVLDNTLSRRVSDGFEGDRRRIADALRSAGPGTQDAVIELRSRPRLVSGFSETRAERDEKVRALRPSFERGAFIDALRLAQSVASQGLGRTKRILVYTDGQANQWSEGATSPPFLEGVDLEIVGKPGAAFRPNLSVAEPAVRRFFLGDKSFVELTAILRHDGDFPAAHVRLEASGKTILRQDVELQGKTGSVTLEGQWEADPNEWLSGTLALEDAGDALPADDRVSFCAPPVREGRVALLARSRYLRTALAPDVMRGRWATTVLDPASPALGAGDLPDVLVLEGDYAQSEHVRDFAFRCLNNGKGVLLFLGRRTPLLDAFLKELGIEAGAEVAAADPFRFVDTSHPILRPFQGGELGDILAPRVLRHLKVKGEGALPLIFGESGDPLLLEGRGTKGRLLLFPFAADREGTDWPLLPTFVPFLDLGLQHARAETPLETSVLPGEVFLHAVPPGGAKAVAIRAGQEVLSRARVEEGRPARLEAPGEPGVYAITYDESPATQALVAVNPSPRESELHYLADPPALAAWTLPRKPASEPEARVLPAIVAARDQHFWWWLLLAAVALLVLESGLLIARREAL
jgi:hypothetical protein